MIKKQFTLYMDNKPGMLGKLARLLGKADVNLEGISVAESTDVALVQIIVDKATKAQRATIPDSEGRRPGRFSVRCFFSCSCPFESRRRSGAFCSAGWRSRRSPAPSPSRAARMPFGPSPFCPLSILPPLILSADGWAIWIWI